MFKWWTCSSCIRYYLTIHRWSWCCLRHCWEWSVSLENLSKESLFYADSVEIICIYGVTLYYLQWKAGKDLNKICTCQGNYGHAAGLIIWTQMIILLGVWSLSKLLTGHSGLLYTFNICTGPCNKNSSLFS